MRLVTSELNVGRGCRIGAGKWNDRSTGGQPHVKYDHGSVLIGGKIRILGLVHREWRAECFEELRLSCSRSVVGNLDQRC